MIRVGELVGASEVVFGEVRLGRSSRCASRAIDLQTSRQLPDVADEAALADLFRAVRAASSERLAHDARPPRHGAAPAAPPSPLEAFENYVKGLVAATPAAQQRFLETRDDAGAARRPRSCTALWAVYTEQGAARQGARGGQRRAAPTRRYATRARFDVALSLIELKRFDGAFKELTALVRRSGARPPCRTRSASCSCGAAARPSRRPATRYFERAVERGSRRTPTTSSTSATRARSRRRGGRAALAARDRPARRRRRRRAPRHERGARGDRPHRRGAARARARAAARHVARDAAGERVGEGPAGARAARDGARRGRARSTPRIANPAQRDQQDTARVSPARRPAASWRRSSDREAIERAAARDLSGAVRRRAAPAARPAVSARRTARRGDRRVQGRDLVPRDAPPRASRSARALLESGDKDAARREAERALVLAPDARAEARELLKKTGGPV